MFKFTPKRAAYSMALPTEEIDMFTVTLKQLRQTGACVDGYNKVVCMLSGKEFDADRETYIRFKHEEEISLIDIANNNGIGDALWATRCLAGHDRDLRLYAVWCARQVQHLMTDARSINALDVAERHANGNASDDELAAARAAARDSARDAVRDSARDAAVDAVRDSAWAAAGAAAGAAVRAAAWDPAWDSAWAAVRAAAWDSAWDAQKQMFIDMCNGVAPWQK